MTEMRITQYGLSRRAGGWDPDGDASTDHGFGDHGNLLVDGQSCALTRLAAETLALSHGQWIQIVWDNGYSEKRSYDDTAPEADARVDLFNRNAFNNAIRGDFATVAQFHP
jgi:hypothetical protein